VIAVGHHEEVTTAVCSCVPVVVLGFATRTHFSLLLLLWIVSVATLIGRGKKSAANGQ